jgi:hypothetical protein
MTSFKLAGLCERLVRACPSSRNASKLEPTERTVVIRTLINQCARTATTGSLYDLPKYGLAFLGET